MSNALVRQAIEAYLVLDTSVACVFENSGASAPSPCQFGFFMPAQPDDQEIGSRMTRLNGLYQINLSYPAGEGAGDAEARAEALRQYFKRGTSLINGAITVRITHTPQISKGGPVADRWVVPVTLRWDAWST